MNNINVSDMKEIDPNELFTCNWKCEMQTQSNNVAFIQTAIGIENFQNKLLNPPMSNSILLQKVNGEESCTFRTKLLPWNDSNCRVHPLGWFLVTEARFIEVYADKSYLATSRGSIITDDVLKSPRSFPMYEHMFMLPEIKKFNKFVYIKFLGLPGDKSSVYISEWTIEFSLIKETPTRYSGSSKPNDYAPFDMSRMIKLLSRSDVIPLDQVENIESVPSKTYETNPIITQEVFKDTSNILPSLKEHIDIKINELKMHFDEKLQSLDKKLDMIIFALDKKTKLNGKKIHK